MIQDTVNYIFSQVAWHFIRKSELGKLFMGMSHSHESSLVLCKEDNEEEDRWEDSGSGAD